MMLRISGTFGKHLTALVLPIVCFLLTESAVAEDVPRLTIATHRFGGVQLMTVGIDGSNPTQLTNDPDDATQGTWCPDGSRIAYAVGPRLNGKIKVMDADGQNAHLLFDGGGPQRTPQWSPDGKQIAFSMRVDQNARNFNVFVVNEDGSGLTNITDAAVTSLDPGWSPDSSMIVYVSHGPNRPGRLWVMKADGADKHDLLGRDLDVAIYPSWTSDGKQVTFGCPDQNKQIQLMQVNLDGSGTTTLTHGPKPHSYAAWSPDGQYLAYVSDPGGHSCDLCIYDVLADEHHVVLKGEVFEELHRDARPSWVPKKR